MLNLNIRPGVPVKIGTYSLRATKVWTRNGLSASFVLTGQSFKPREFTLPPGRTERLFDEVFLHLYKVTIASKPMIRIGIEAPNHIEIINGKGRPPKVKLESLSDMELVNYGRQWGITPLEDALLNRIERLGEELS